MTATTIITPFDPKSLPLWAQRIPAVVARCMTDLTYRADVCSAATGTYRRFLARKATQ